MSLWQKKKSGLIIVYQLIFYLFVVKQSNTALMTYVLIYLIKYLDTYMYTHYIWFLYIIDTS